MRHSTIPKPPAPEDITIFQTWDIRPDEGKVFNAKGQEIGSGRKGVGYVYIGTYRDKPRFFHRSHLIWWKAKGYWPRLELDHDDRVKTNDKIGNLKEATHRENAGNNGKTNSLPVGVVLHKQTGRYVAQIDVNNRHIYIGIYKTVEEALLARKAYEATLSE